MLLEIRYSGVQCQELQRRSQRAAETRRRILNGALDLFVANGYGATNLQAVADRAGVAIQTIYFVFGTSASCSRSLSTSRSSETTSRSPRWSGHGSAPPWRRRPPTPCCTRTCGYRRRPVPCVGHHRHGRHRDRRRGRATAASRRAAPAHRAHGRCRGSGR
ncbi:TetR/AcrR family transcriptional regulator [Micromonospora sp. NPDC023966]|uniref:TetR/AcrR family transcriptional regulator n=1 Tax=Micromonospora sp. NPDC023966 TaxID=3154699 RepID=UPI0033D21AA2